MRNFHPTHRRIVAAQVQQRPVGDLQAVVSTCAVTCLLDRVERLGTPQAASTTSLTEFMIPHHELAVSRARDSRRSCIARSGWPA
jgi:hypothetical protein